MSLPNTGRTFNFNAAQARAVKEAGQEAVLQTKAPLPTAAQKKTALGY